MKTLVSLAFYLVIIESLFFSKSLHASVDFSCESKSPNIVIRVLFVGNDKWDHFKWSKTSHYKHDVQVFLDRSSGPQIDSKPDFTIKSEAVRKFLFANKSIEIKAVNDSDLPIMEFSGTRKRDNSPFLINGFIYFGSKRIHITKAVFDCGVG